MIKVATNGFGHTGRLAFRQMLKTEGYGVVAINDSTKSKMLTHLLKYDTSQGSSLGKIGGGKHMVKADEDSITIDGKKITIYKGADVKNLSWKALDVDVALECTGFYTSKEKASVHLEAGVKKVVISVSAGNDLLTIVFNVSEKVLTKEDKIISAASCMTSCFAPMAEALDDYVPIQSGTTSTIHAYTGDRMIFDGPQKKGDLRGSRVGATNIVPNSTSAAKVIGLAIPKPNGKLIGSAQRVPVTIGFTTILVAVVTKDEATKEEINAAMKVAANEPFGYSTDEIIPFDVISMRYGSLSDVTQTMVNKIADGCYQVQVVSWCDNENSYASQMARTIEHLTEL